MFSSPFLTTLLLAAAAWKGADLYHQASLDAARHAHAMTVDTDTSPRRPAIDLEAPAAFETATFALG